MEVENSHIWKVTTFGGTHFGLSWLWEEVYVPGAFGVLQQRKNPLRPQIIDFGLACHFEHNVKMHTKAMTENPCFFWCTKTMYINAFFWVKCNDHAEMYIWQLLNYGD